MSLPSDYLERVYAGVLGKLIGAPWAGPSRKELDSRRTLAEAALAWAPSTSSTLRLRVVGAQVQGWVDRRLLFDIRDADRPLEGGAVGLIVAEGRSASERVRVELA